MNFEQPPSEKPEQENPDEVQEDIPEENKKEKVGFLERLRRKRVQEQLMNDPTINRNFDSVMRAVAQFQFLKDLEKGDFTVKKIIDTADATKKALIESADGTRQIVDQSKLGYYIDNFGLKVGDLLRFSKRVDELEPGMSLEEAFEVELNPE